MEWLSKALDAIYEDSRSARRKRRLASWIALVGHPLYWAIWAVFYPQYQDSLTLRLLGVGLSLVVHLSHLLPEQLRRHTAAVSYLNLAIGLPMLFTFTLLANEYGALWQASHVSALSLLLLLTPSLPVFVLLSLGGTLAGALWFLVFGDVQSFAAPPLDFLLLLAFAYPVGAVFYFLGTEELLESKRKWMSEAARASNYQTLAGSIAHEMRNPLGQIKLCLENIDNGLPSHTKGAANAHLSDGLNDVLRQTEIAQTAVQRGTQVIDMLLDAVHERPLPAAQFKRLSAAQLVRKAMAEYGFASNAERRRVQVINHGDFYLRGDETALLFVFFNLLKNALYYTQTEPSGAGQPRPGQTAADTRIEIHIGGPGDNGSHRIVFHDNGPGIAPQRIDKLFDSFYSADKQGGTGLGLAYCRRVMRQHGGEISVESALGEYAAFKLEFAPIDEHQLNAERDALLANAQAALRGKTLILADDDPLNHELVAEQTAALTLTLRHAEDGRAVINMLREQQADLVLMDLNMPELNGFQASEQIRDGECGEAAAGMPIIAYTGEPAYRVRAAVRRSGMQGLIGKPCGRDELFSGLLAALAEPVKNRRVDNAWDGKRLLLVDDSESLTEAISLSIGLLLAPATVDCQTANNARKALEIIQTETIDAVITDLNMPGMSGDELARAVHALPEHPQLPIIGLSGDDSATTRQRMIDAGIANVFTKGVSSETLIDALANLLQIGTAKPLRKPGPVAQAGNRAGNQASNRPATVSADPGNVRFMPLKRKPSTSDDGLGRRAEAGIDLADAGRIDEAQADEAQTVEEMAGALLYDIDAAARSLGCRVELVQRGLRQLREQYRDWPRRLQAATDQHDFDALYQLTHQLKGSAMVFHADALTRRCQRLERRCRELRDSGALPGSETEAALTELVRDVARALQDVFHDIDAQRLVS